MEKVLETQKQTDFEAALKAHGDKRRAHAKDHAERIQGNVTARKPKAETIGKMTPTQLTTLIKSVMSGKEFDENATRVFSALLPTLSKTIADDLFKEFNEKTNEVAVSERDWVWSVVGYTDGVFGSVGAPIFKSMKEAFAYLDDPTIDRRGFSHFMAVPLDVPSVG